MNKTIMEKTISGQVIKLTINSADKKFNKLQPNKWIVFQAYTDYPKVFESFFSLAKAEKFFNAYKG